MMALFSRNQHFVSILYPCNIRNDFQAADFRITIEGAVEQLLLEAPVIQVIQHRSSRMNSSLLIDLFLYLIA